MDDEFGREVVSAGDDGFADLACPDAITFRLEPFGSSRSENIAADTPAFLQPRVRGIDYDIHRHFGDIVSDDFQRHGEDLLLRAFKEITCSMNFKKQRPD